MADYTLDDVDRQLLGLLQEDARYTAIELAEDLGVSDNTVHNRIDRLEEAGIITGYSTTIDFDRIGLDLYFSFTCSARISKRTEMVEKILEIPQVVEATELMTGERNIHVKAVAVENDDVTHVAEQIDQLDLEINDEMLIKNERRKSLDLEELHDLLSLPN